MAHKIQKRLAGQILKCSSKRIWLDPERDEEIKEAITKVDVRSLIKNKAIKRKAEKGVSKVRYRKRKVQRQKGRQKGHGKKKGKATARLPKKEAWIKGIRIQREFIRELRDKKLLTTANYRSLYGKCSGGFFRSKRHIKLFIEEHGMIKK